MEWVKRMIVAAGILLLGAQHVSEGIGSPRLARWYGGADAAVSLRFDDSHPSQIVYAIPLLEKYDVKGTFMVNPGKRNYQEFRDAWEKKVPALGHELGNHTMHHKGARDIAEARYEIGTAWDVLSSLQGGEKSIMVFAAGGGTEWNGQLWEDADAIFKNMVQNYGMIDLYDGSHPTKHVHSTDMPQGLCRLVHDAVSGGGHQAFTFHYFGIPDIRDRLRKVAKGYSLTYDPDRFEEFLRCLARMKEKLWIAPLSDIYKYEIEYGAFHIENLTVKGRIIKFMLYAGKTNGLYDQPVTVVLPLGRGEEVVRITQNGKTITALSRKRNDLLFDVEPVCGDIVVELK